MAERLLTKQEAAERTRLSPHTLDWLHRQGRGPKGRGKLGRRVFYTEASVDQWIADQLAATA